MKIPMRCVSINLDLSTVSAQSGELEKKVYSYRFYSVSGWFQSLELKTEHDRRWSLGDVINVEVE